MDAKFIAGVVVVAVVAGGGGYYMGIKNTSGQMQNAQGQRFGQSGQRGRLGGGGGALGTVVSKDAQSITIQLMGPAASSTTSGTGSKVVLYDTRTQVGEFKTGSTKDLSVGQLVSVQGTVNSDGSITAQMIQIRPDGMGRPNGQSR